MYSCPGGAFLPKTLKSTLYIMCFGDEKRNWVRPTGNMDACKWNCNPVDSCLYPWQVFTTGRCGRPTATHRNGRCNILKSERNIATVPGRIKNHDLRRRSPLYRHRTCNVEKRRAKQCRVNRLQDCRPGHVRNCCQKTIFCSAGSVQKIV